MASAISSFFFPGDWKSFGLVYLAFGAGSAYKAKVPASFLPFGVGMFAVLSPVWGILGQKMASRGVPAGVIYAIVAAVPVGFVFLGTDGYGKAVYTIKSAFEGPMPPQAVVDPTK